MVVDEDIYLEHYGTKGMKWGVRKERETSSGDRKRVSKEEKKSATNEYLKFAKANAKAPISAAEQYAALVENRKKSLSKIGIETEASPSKSVSPKNPHSRRKKEAEGPWRPTNKQIAIAAGGAAFIGVAIFASQTQTGRNLVKSALGIPKPESSVTPDQFNKAVLMSQMSTWTKPDGKGYLKPGSFLQDEMTFPPGHTFRRLSKSAETGFKGATYSVPNQTCFNRYLTNFKNELTAGTGGSGFFSIPAPTLHEVTFKAKQEVKVPSLTRAIETMRETLSEQRGSPVSREEALAKFSKMSGGAWIGDTADNFFGKLSKQGYHAIVDHMDAGVIGDSPLVIFKSDAFTNKAARALSESDFKKAADNLIELSNRKL